MRSEELDAPSALRAASLIRERRRRHRVHIANVTNARANGAARPMAGPNSKSRARPTQRAGPGGETRLPPSPIRRPGTSIRQGFSPGQLIPVDHRIPRDDPETDVGIGDHADIVKRLPSTTGKSASATCCTIPSFPGRGLRLPERASNSTVFSMPDVTRWRTPHPMVSSPLCLKGSLRLKGVGQKVSLRPLRWKA